MALIHDNLALVKSKIAEAARRSRRLPESVELIAVSKTFPVESIQKAYDAGQRVFGENRPQEMLTKTPGLPKDVRWHLIGPLQSNKVRKVLPVAAAIHSVASVDTARTIQRISTELQVTTKIFLEVNVAGEASKFGFAPADLESTLEAVLNMDRLDIQGLMCVPPIVDEPEESRKHFIFLREKRDQLEPRFGIKLPSLSMGMSGDYQVAVEEGATHVRVGSAIFGHR